MFHWLLALPEKTRAGYDLGSLRSVVHGAAPCPVQLGAPLPAGREGLVFLRALRRGRLRYFGDDAKTASAYRGDSFTLGDVGYLGGGRGGEGRRLGSARPPARAGSR